MTEDTQTSTGASSTDLGSQETQPSAELPVATDDEKIIPHMIYLLSFVLNVHGQHDAGGKLLTPQDREPICKALGLDQTVADKMNNNLPATLNSRQLRNFHAAFRDSSEYPGGTGGCPKNVNALVKLAKQWRASAP